MEQIYPSLMVTTALANKFPTLLLNRNFTAILLLVLEFGS